MSVCECFAFLTYFILLSSYYIVSLCYFIFLILLFISLVGSAHTRSLFEKSETKNFYYFTSLP